MQSSRPSFPASPASPPKLFTATHSNEPGLKECVIGDTPPIGELTWFHCAVAVAEELHFTRAASRLRMEQSAVSRHIQKLELALGYPLFERDKRRVELTDAGKAFIPYARTCLEYARTGILRARAIGRGEPSEFHVGYSPSVDVHLIAQIQALVEGARPRIPVFFRSVATEELISSLQDGKLQAGLVALPIDRDFATACLLRERLLVALPVTHRLARRRRISVTELGDDPVIWTPSETHPAFFQFLLSLFRRAGYYPNFSRETLSVSETLGLVGEGLGIAFVTTSEQRFHGKGLVIRPLEEPFLTADTGVAYLGESKWEFLREFVRLLTSHFSCSAPVGIELGG